MFAMLALRNLRDRPWRSALLFFGYGTGVAVMIVLLSIGEALITQARDERLVGGGTVTVLPEGLDIEVMKTGGLGGLFFSIGNARFVQLQLLGAPRLANSVTAVAPQIDGKLLYLRKVGAPLSSELPVRGSADVPSATRAVGAAPLLAAGAWEDDAGDRAWVAPTDEQLRHAIDRFHIPPSNVANARSWAEWHYFNVLSADEQRWAFISFIVAGDVPDGEWGGQLLVTTHVQGRPARRFEITVPSSAVQLSTTRADLSLGENTVRVLPDGRYAVRATAREPATGAQVTVDLVVAPAPRAYFPGASLASGDFVSGYAVAGLRASATGSLCIDGRCERYDGAQSYHDHNWGVWRGVSWEWGASRAGAYTLLFGKVQPPDESVAGVAGAPTDGAAGAPLFLYLVDSLGFRAVFRPRAIRWEDGRTITVDGKRVQVPSRGEMTDVRGADTLRVVLEVEDATGTDMRRGAIERGDADTLMLAYMATLARPYFIQMKGIARISGRVGGVPVAGEGTGFFETYR